MKIQGICSLPFTHIRVDSDGNVGFCQYQIPDIDHPFVFIGNVFHHDFNSIWFGAKAEACREALIEGSYNRICQMSTCPFYSTNTKQKHNIGFGEYPQVLELTGDSTQFVKIVNALDAVMGSIQRVIIDCPSNEVNDISYITSNIPIVLNLHWANITYEQLSVLLKLPVSEYTVIQPTNDRLPPVFHANKKVNIRYTFSANELNIVLDIINTFTDYPINSFELDINVSDVNKDNCGLFKRAEVIVCNYLDAKRVPYKVIRPFDLNLTKKFF